jgi:hypothetical protein
MIYGLVTSQSYSISMESAYFDVSEKLFFVSPKVAKIVLWVSLGGTTA